MKNEDYPNGQHHPIPDARGDTRIVEITNQQFPASHTSNDLWSRLDAMQPPAAMNYEVVAQNADEVTAVQIRRERIGGIAKTAVFSG